MLILTFITIFFIKDYKLYDSEPMQPRYFSLVALNMSRVSLVSSCALSEVGELQQTE